MAAPPAGSHITYGLLQFSRDVLVCSQPSERTGLLFTFIISVAIFLALSFLMGWHVFLVCTAQTTIEFYNNQRERQAQRANGGGWVNRFDRGVVQNWQEVFDERGTYWWFVWMLPRTRRHSTSGVFWPTVAHMRSEGVVGNMAAGAGKDEIV
jgi:hypothetical protein